MKLMKSLQSFAFERPAASQNVSASPKAPVGRYAFKSSRCVWPGQPMRVARPAYACDQASLCVWPLPSSLSSCFLFF
uniref:Unnamed protein product n=1 Tax=Macaca fascicularis TaxID=9541 RepID=Q9N046_MACFA|nr:unnamed protein product [Macaca fascicularis]